MKEKTIPFERLVKIMDELREKCPWDRKQTIASLRSLTLEEAYELAEAIDASDWQGLKEELGDLLLHIVFYARIAREESQFTLEEVINGICDKLIARHPHVYGSPGNAGEPIQVKDEEEVKQNWEKLKLKEGKKSVLGGVPAGLPSMVKAMRLQEKAKQVGFEWDAREQVWEKVKEEMAELQEAVSAGEAPAMAEELGDLLFSLVNYARFLRVDPDQALDRTNRKFIDRFTRMEKEALGRGKDLSAMTLEEMDAIWNEIKQRPRDT